MMRYLEMGSLILFFSTISFSEESNNFNLNSTIKALILEDSGGLGVYVERWDDRLTRTKQDLTEIFKNYVKEGMEFHFYRSAFVHLKEINIVFKSKTYEDIFEKAVIEGKLEIGNAPFDNLLKKYRATRLKVDRKSSGPGKFKVVFDNSNGFQLDLRKIALIFDGSEIVKSAAVTLLETSPKNPSLFGNPSFPIQRKRLNPNGFSGPANGRIYILTLFEEGSYLSKIFLLNSRGVGQRRKVSVSLIGETSILDHIDDDLNPNYRDEYSKSVQKLKKKFNQEILISSE